MDQNLINEFIKKLNKNAPFNSGKINSEKYKGYFYPYKPILLIAIIKNIHDVNHLFNQQILIDKNSNITKTYYDILINSEVMCDFLNNEHHLKENWLLIYNDQVKKQVVKNIFENPASHLQLDNFFIINRKNKTIEIKASGTLDELLTLKQLLLKEALKCLYKCIPEYQGLSLNEIINYEGYIQENILLGVSPNVNNETKSRRYQHIFAKIIFERDQKCMICCLDLPELLQAAHIKPYSKCDNDLDRYNANNGILLCCNHHKLYDRGYFTFTNDWKVKISKELSEKDANLLLKTFEPCFINLANKFMLNSANEYISYHYKHIFRE